LNQKYNSNKTSIENTPIKKFRHDEEERRKERRKDEE